MESHEERTGRAVVVDSLKHVFPSDMRQRLSRAATLGSDLYQRLEILNACGPCPTDHRMARRLAWLRRKKAAWEAYIDAAILLNLLGDDDHGRELLRRLQSPDNRNFRSAMAECCAAWFLRSKLGLEVTPRPKGRKGRILDLALSTSDGKIAVEVKAPRRRPTQAFGAWVGNDADLLQKQLEEANRQFSRDSRNLLILVPELREPLHQDRYQLVQAFYAEAGLDMPFDENTGSLGEPKPSFELSGHFLKQWPDRADDRRRPRFTRVGAVLSIEEIHESDRIGHRALVAHNPAALAPISEALWDDLPQAVERDGALMWSDGRSMFP